MSQATEPPDDAGHRDAEQRPQPTEEGSGRLAGFAAALAGFSPSSGDSAGQPWQGREFDDNPFGDDDGSAPPALLGALAAFRAAEVGAEAVVDALRGVRVLIPPVAEAGEELGAVRARVKRTGEELGGRLRLLVGKPGLDGHSNGAEQVAVRARDAGFEVIYQGIRLTPEQIVSAAVAEDVHCVGLSILSGSHMELVPAVLSGLEEAGLGDVPVVVGGIIPTSDGRRLVELGVAAVYTPKDFGLTEIMDGIVDVIRKANDLD